MSKLLAAVNKSRKGGSEREDEYFYYPARDPSGNGSAVFRFLPMEDDSLPYVKVHKHNFKVRHGDKDRWYIEECLTTVEGIGECPACAYNKTLYATKSKEDARKHGVNRKTSYISRILVIEDKKNPENEGKVFLYKYGKVIFDKIADALTGDEEDNIAPMNVFNVDGEPGVWANFKLRIRKVDDETNYDKSSFVELTPEELDAGGNYLSQFNENNNPHKFLDKSNFKTVEKLQERLDFVLGNSNRDVEAPKEVESKPARSSLLEKMTGGDDDAPPARTPAKKADAKESKRVEVLPSSDDDNGELDSLIASITSGDDDVPQ